MELLEQFERGAAWTASKIDGARDQLDASTPCEKWDVRAIVNHLLDGQRFFCANARGEQADRPADMPDDLLGDRDPVAAFNAAVAETIAAYGEPGAIDKTGPLLGICLADTVIHGWDIATATGQDATMPEGLADTAFGVVNGRISDDVRGRGFGPAIDVPDDAPVQDRLLAYTGHRA